MWNTQGGDDQRLNCSWTVECKTSRKATTSGRFDAGKRSQRSQAERTSEKAAGSDAKQLY